MGSSGGMNARLGGWTVVVALGAFLGLLSAGTADAQVRLNEAVEMLDASDSDTVQLGIEALGTNGTARAVAPLSARIRRGLPPELLDMAIQTLGVLGRPEAGPVLFELTNHRRVEVRVAATEAIGSCRPRGAAASLVTLLSDGDPQVRATAAIALGTVGTAAQLDDLFLAFDRGLNEASPAIGQLADAAGADRLLAYLGRKPLDAITPGLDEILARTDIAARVKLRVLGKLEELATPEVRTYLESLAEALPAGAIQNEARAAAGRITGG